MAISIYNHVITPVQSLDIIGEGSYKPSQEIAEHIKQRLAENPLPFDGTSWCLNGYTVDVRSKKVTLQVGHGSYSHYRYTNLDAELRLKVPDQRQWFNALALGAMVETRDKKIVLTKRPKDAHLSGGRLDMPCGHPSDIFYPPDNLVLERALKNVIHRELGVATTFISTRPLLLILEEPKAAWDLMFYIQISETSNELLASMDQGKFGRLLENNSDAIADFLRTQEFTSRPVEETLLYYGREYFSESWFQQFCLEHN